MLHRICLLVNRWMRLAVWLLAVQFVGILAPLALLAGRLFSGPYGAPTLEGQYVLKDVILMAAGMTIAAGTFRGGRLIRDEPDIRDDVPVGPVDGLDASRKLQIVMAAGDGRSLQDVCEEHDISLGTYYAWRAATVHGALRALDDHADAERP